METEQPQSNYLIEIETLQPSALRGVFTTLKEQVSEAYINITPEGINILQMDATHVVICQVDLKATNFDKYICKRSVKLGVDIHNLAKVLKGVGAKDILTIFVEDPSNQIGGFEDPDAQQHFGLRVENTEKGQVSTIYIDLRDINEDEIEIPDLDYPYCISMPSADLQSIANNMKNMEGDVAQIRYVKGVLYFYTKGDVGRFDISRSKTSKEENSIRILKNFEDADEIIEIYVKLQKLVEFAKGASLCTMATIYLKNDFPLFIEYDVGSLGFIRFGISHHKKPDNF